MLTRRSLLKSSPLLALAPAVPLFVGRAARAAEADAPGLVAVERIPANEWRFAYPLRTRADRESVRVGEAVKVVFRSRDGAEERVTPRWTTVVSVTPTRPSYIARLYPLGEEPTKWGLAPDGLLAFGPEHVYRMPSRRFAVWGEAGTPKALRCDSGPPTDPDENPLPGCSERVAEFTAAGWDDACRRYAEMAASRSNWPRLEQLL